MNSTTKLFGFFLFALALSFMACKGEDGLMGSTGPAGTNGVDGRDGIDGQNGQDGEDGNANTFISQWEEVTFSPASGTFGTFNQDAPEITSDVYENAVVIGYVKTGSEIFPLPNAYSIPSQIMDASIQIGNYQYQFLAGASWTPPTIQGRYVIIYPAGRHAAQSDSKQAILDELSAAEVDLTDYDQVAKYLNIIE